MSIECFDNEKTARICQIPYHINRLRNQVQMLLVETEIVVSVIFNLLEMFG